MLGKVKPQQSEKVYLLGELFNQLQWGSGSPCPAKGYFEGRW